MATKGKSNKRKDEGVNRHADIGIAGFGKIIHIEDGFGFMRSTSSEKYRICFSEKHFHPPTDGIIATLKIGDHLHFEARPCTKKGGKIIYLASIVWKSEANEILESVPFYDEATQKEAMEYLRYILLKKTKVSLDISKFHPLLSNASPQVRDFLLNEKNVKKLLGRFPSVFQFSASANTVLLVDEKVQRAINCVVDQLVNKAFMGLSTLLEAVSSAPKEIRVMLGYDAVQFKKFLQQYSNVFRVYKKNGNVSVSLRLEDACPEEDTDSCDAQSVDSFSSTTTFNGINSSSLSAKMSVSSLDKASRCHKSANSPSTDLKTAGLSAKQQGISKLLNALLNKEPIPLKNLIGYIHTSPPEVRNIIGNKMDKLTHFIRNDSNFFLLEPLGLVFIRTTVEKRALMHLMNMVRQFEAVKLTDLLKLDVEKTAPEEVRALLGKDFAAISTSVQSLLAKQELVPYCNLMLHNNIISVRSCSQRPFNCKSIVNDSISDAVSDEASAEPTAGDGSAAFYEKCESKAVEFLRRVVERYDLLAVVNLKNYLWHVSAEVRLILQNENLIRDFVGRHPSVFKLFIASDVIELVDDNIQEAIEFISNILTVRGDLLITSLVGHLSSGSVRIRRVTGGRPDQMAEFLKHYFDVFHVFEAQKGLMVALKRQESSQDKALSSFGQKIDESCQTLAAVDIDASQPVSVNLSDAVERVELKIASDDLEFDFLVDLLKDRGPMCLEDILRCVSEAPQQIQDELGRCKDEILAYMEESPAVFKVLPGRCHVELVSEEEGNAIEFFLDVLNKLGPIPVSEICSYLSQATGAICKLTGYSPKSVTAFFLQFPNVFRIFRDKEIEMIESMYEGKGDSGGDDDDDDLDSKRPAEQRKTFGPEIRITSEAAAKFDDIDFCNIVALPWIKPGKAASECPPPEASLHMNDGISVQEGMLSDNEFVDNTKVKLEDIHVSESSVDRDQSSDPVSDACLAFDQNDLPNDKKIISSSKGKLDCGFRVDACAETRKELTSTEFQSKESHLKILSLKNFMKDAKDEQNVVADLCYERMVGSAAKSFDVTELLSICQLADPFGKNWKNALKLQHLIEILQSDDRFFFDKTNNRTFLRKDVEGLAVAFLRSCINCHGPIDLSGLKYYDYLKMAALEVQAILSSGTDPDAFARKAIKGLWPKYRDQLNVVDEALIVSCDIETEAIAFLSKLIETLGPIPVKMLYKHLLQAPVEVSRYFEEKLVNIELHLTSSNLVKHFCLIDETVDLVRSGNLQKSLLIVERLAVCLIVDVIRTQGPMSLKAINKVLPDVATPAVRQLLGNQWNASVYKKSLLKKLCLKRSDVFIMGTNTINLVEGSYQSHELSETVSSASSSIVPYADALKSALEPSFKSAAKEMAVGFLVDIISKKGLLNLRDNKLEGNALLPAPPLVRTLLGGEACSVKFKKDLVTEFCSGFPNIFKVYKHSVDLNRSNVSAKVASVVTDKGLLNSVHHITSSMFPILPNANQPQELSKPASLASSSVVLPCADASASASISAKEMAVEFLVDIISKKGLLNLRDNKLESNALLRAKPSVRVLLGGEVTSLKFKKDLVTEFCSGFPSIFKVFKKSVDLNMHRAAVETVVAKSISGSHSQGLKPTNPSKDTLLGSSSAEAAAAAMEKGLFSSVVGKSPHNIQHVTGPKFPILPNAVFPAAFSSSGAVPVFPTYTTSINQCPMHISFPDLYFRPPHGIPMTPLPLAIPAVATPVPPPQSVYFPDNHVPKQSYPSFSSLHPIMLPDSMDLRADMFRMTRLQHSTAQLGLDAASISMPNANVRNGRTSSSPSMQPITAQSTSDGKSPMSCTPSTVQLPTVGLASVNSQSPAGMSGQSTSTAITFTEDLLVTAGNISSRLNETDFHINQESILNSEDSKVTDLEMAEVKLNQTFEIGRSIDGDSCQSDDSNCLKEINYSLDVNRNSLPTLCSFEQPDLHLISNVASKTIDSVGEQTEMNSSVEEAKCNTLVQPPSAVTSDQVRTLPLSWQSTASLLQVPSFKEEFREHLEGLSDCFDFLDREASKIGLANDMSDDRGDDRCQSIADERNCIGENEEVVNRRMNGVVLSAQGNLLYIKRDDGHLISCSSENCCRHFKSCSDIGRHFAIGETVSIISDKLSKSISVCHSSTDAHVSEDHCNNPTSSTNFRISREACCDGAYIRYGRGHICLLSDDLIGVVMGSHEMAALVVGAVNHQLLLNDVVSFSARKVRCFMAPWMLEDVEKTVQPTTTTIN